MKQFWKGTYKLHEFVVIKDPNNLEFCLVTTMEQDEDNRWRVITSIVLFYWISQDGKCILYPQQLIGGKGPNEWDCRVFLRFQVPQDDWFEYDIHEMVYKNGRKGTIVIERLLLIIISKCFLLLNASSKCFLPLYIFV